MKNIKEKTFKNALIGERLLKLTKEERQKIVVNLLSNTTERALEKELGIPRATLNDWKTLRQNNKGEHIHLSLSLILRKLENLDSKKIVDWGRITQIKEVCESLLRAK